ncbi:MAG: ImmA/IrrE family metallo-endopeptidase [Pirellulales bacterium]
MMVRRKHVRAAAAELLERFEFEKTPVPVEKVARALGISVQRSPVDDDDLSGFLYRNRKDAITVIGVNESHAKARQRFTIAHEIGHFILHDMDDVHVDRGFSVKLRSGASSEGRNIEEIEANLFAAELLMPKEFLDRDLADIDSVDLVDEEVIADLARRYGVSTQAMTFRLGYLGYVQL